MTIRSIQKSRFFLVILIMLIIGGSWYGWHSFSSEKNTDTLQNKLPGPPHGGPGDSRKGANKNQLTSVYADTANTANVAVYLDALGTVEADTSVTVTSRVTGEMTKVFFIEGQYVNAGDQLAQIDDRSYRATLAQYQGELAQNMALLKSAQATLRRYKNLAKENSISDQDVQEQAATVGQYQGIVATDKAQIASAQLDIEYAKIEAPISGYTGLLDVDQGNLITGDSTSIVTITQINPITVTFNIPQANLQEVLQGVRQKKAFPVILFNQTGEEKLAQGMLENISNSIDTDTGTITLQAVFNNDNEILYPNQFVNVRMQTKQLQQAVVIPKAAIQLNDAGNFVFIIGTDNKVHKQTVDTGPVYNEDQVVALSGVKSGERLVTTGVDNLVDGSKVKIMTQAKENK